jgi:hypothetical protein
MKRNILSFGIGSGVLLTVYILLLDLTRVIYETTWGQWLGYLAIVILPIAVWLAMQKLKKQQDTWLFRHSLTVSLSIAIVAASVYSAYTFVDVHFFGATHLQNLFSFTEKQMRQEGATAAAINEQLDRLRGHYSSWKPYRNTYIWYTAMGVIYGSLFHLILLFQTKRKPKQI